jgi:hypothetical protein
MRGERQLLRLGEYLIRRASRQLPRKARDERYREWAAELPVILHDPQVRFAPRRALRMIAYAADTFRSTALIHVRSRRRRVLLAMAAVHRLLLVACLALVTWTIWTIAQEPGQPLNYVLLCQCLLLTAWVVGTLTRPAARTAILVVTSANLLGMACSAWLVVQDPGDWVNYFSAALLALVLLVLWPLSRGVRAAQHSGAHRRA